MGEPAVDTEPASTLWRNRVFVRVWAAATVSVFGTNVSRIALPFVAILVLHVGPLAIAAIRVAELVSAVVVGTVAGAWVDRLRRRPVMIWADVGRAVALGSIPIVAIGHWLTLAQLLAVAAIVAALSVFFEVADRAYLPSIVEREQLVRANGTLVGTTSAAEFSAFSIGGFLIQAFTAPFAIAVDALSYVASAVLLGSIRRPEPAPPPVAEREPIATEFRVGYRVVARDPVLRALVWGAMGQWAMWGVFSVTWLLYLTRDLDFTPGKVGVIAAIGPGCALVGALLSTRAVRRFGIGSVATGSLLVVAVGSLFVPLAPAELPLVALSFLLAQQLLVDASAALQDITELSIRQSRVEPRQLGRVNATVKMATALAQLTGTIAGGAVAAAFGLRAATFLLPAAALLGGLAMWRSPLRSVRTVEIDALPSVGASGA